MRVVVVEYVIGGSMTRDRLSGQDVSVQLFDGGRAHVIVDGVHHFYAHAERIIADGPVTS